MVADTHNDFCAMSIEPFFRWQSGEEPWLPQQSQEQEGHQESECGAACAGLDSEWGARDGACGLDNPYQQQAHPDTLELGGAPLATAQAAYGLDWESAPVAEHVSPPTWDAVAASTPVSVLSIGNMSGR